MSSNSGGATGITGQYVRDAQDVTRQKKRQMAYLDGKSGGFGIPVNNFQDKGNESYINFLFGKKACDGGCTGLPFQKNTPRFFR